ncbi:unnamed protein product [Arabis nemorensis]|uniref:cellulase n=1 Tax=Arabis nemorensis TaxID=586526 RepID=A0A565C7L6_9BRAS|nr:unnamed protein product [Arabis nemorensis]
MSNSSEFSSSEPKLQEQQNEALLRKIETLKCERDRLQIMNERLHGESCKRLSFPELKSLQSQLCQGRLNVDQQMRIIKMEDDKLVKQEKEDSYLRQLEFSKKRKFLRLRAKDRRRFDEEIQQELAPVQMKKKIKYLKREVKRLRLLNEIMIGNKLEGMGYYELMAYQREVLVGLVSVHRRMRSLMLRPKEEELISVASRVKTLELETVELETMQPGDFIIKYCSKLGMSQQAVKLKLLRKPCLNVRKLIEEISTATGVAEGTIRNSYRDLSPRFPKIAPSWYAKEEDLKNLSRKPSIYSSIVLLLLTILPTAISHDYSDALTKSILFFEGQRSGYLPKEQRMTWRRNSALNDGKNLNVDLVGGYYDAGDNIKFHFPMAFSTTMLAWSAVEFGSYMSPADLRDNLAAVRWGTDYLLKTVSQFPNRIFVQVGEATPDHQCWERPEDMDTPRTAYAVEAPNSASDFAGEIVAALAAASIAFKRSDPNYAKRLEVFEKNAAAIAPYKDIAEKMMCSFFRKTHMTYTPGGLLYKPSFTQLQNTVALSFLLLTYAGYLSKSSQQLHCGNVKIKPDYFRRIAKRQVDYILGDNPMKLSYMISAIWE